MHGNITCKLCGFRDIETVRKGVRVAPDVEVLRCANCGLVFLWPMPGEEELADYYTVAYREDYGEPSVQDRYRSDMDEARVRVRRLLPLLGPGSRLLEIGSGSGAFLDAVGPYVARVMGVEPDETSRKWIEGLTGQAISEELPDAIDAGESPDLIVMFHVLEHVPDPVGFLKRIWALLRPDGTLVVEVPNVDDALVAVYNMPSYQEFYYQKAHLYYFSSNTLAMTLKQAGFTAQIGGLQRYDLSNHIRWALTGQPGGHGYYDRIFMPSTNAAYAESLIQAGHADTLWAVARRTESTGL